MNNAYFVSVDFQYDFVDKNGKNPCFGNSPEFIKKELFPWLQGNNIEIFEIISDYRLPRGKSINESCIPNTEGFMSLIPDAIKNTDIFVKCMHNPIWSRENIGDATKIPSDVFPAPDRFSKWVSKNMPNKKFPIILFGETMDCCILNVAQEFYFRGYEVYVIYEGSDPMKERMKYKEEVAYHSSLSIYAKVLKFKEIKELVHNDK